MDERLKAIKDEYGLEASDMWQLPQNKQWLIKHGNDWGSGPWSHQTNIPCRECNGTGMVEAEPITLEDCSDHFG